MTRLSEIEQRCPITSQRTTILNAAISIARAMEKAHGKLREKLQTPVVFVTPGFNQWQSALQRFVYLVTEICQFREVHFAICELESKRRRSASLLAIVHGVYCLSVKGSTVG